MGNYIFKMYYEYKKPCQTNGLEGLDKCGAALKMARMMVDKKVGSSLCISAYQCVDRDLVSSNS